MASIQDLPDEIILKVINYLAINKRVKFGEVSKRMRAISCDKTLWQKMNVSRDGPSCYEIDIPTNFVKTVIENGCQYLSLHYMKVGTPGGPKASEGHLILDKASSLQYLDLKYCKARVLTFEEILASCHSLRKLSMASISIWERKLITTKMIRSICYQNGRTLQTLDLSLCGGVMIDSIRKITKHCVGLKNIDLSGTGLSHITLSFLVNNLTPEVEKLNIGSLRKLNDEHVKALVTRCNKLSVLNLQNTTITDDSLTHIIKKLQHSLEKLNVRYCHFITYTKVTELRSMPKFRVLKYGQSWKMVDHEKEALKNMMPLVRFDESICADERKLLPADGIWDVEAKQLKYFELFDQRNFHDLPDETVLRVTFFLEEKDLVNFGQVSKRMRAIAQSRVDYTDAINPIPTGRGRNQATYECHVTTAGRNRVKSKR